LEIYLAKGLGRNLGVADRVNLLSDTWGPGPGGIMYRSASIFCVGGKKLAGFDRKLAEARTDPFSRAGNY